MTALSNAAGLCVHDNEYDQPSCQRVLEELLEQDFLEVVTMTPPNPDQPWTLTGPWYGILFSHIRAWCEIDDDTEPLALRPTGPRARLSALANPSTKRLTSRPLAPMMCL